jgi:hypothetical protein
MKAPRYPLDLYIRKYQGYPSLCSDHFKYKRNLEFVWTIGLVTRSLTKYIYLYLLLDRDYVNSSSFPEGKEIEGKEIEGRLTTLFTHVILTNTLV